MTRDGLRLLAVLKRTGLLLMSDAALPSAVTVLVGAPVKGSWWGHPDGNRLYNTMNELFDHADVAAVPLVNGKVTFVYRELWPALAGVGASGEAWQTVKLAAEATALLKRVRKDGEVKAAGPAAKLLETRLSLTDGYHKTPSGSPAHRAGRGAPGSRPVSCDSTRAMVGEQEHTESGAHAKILRTWPLWAEGRGVKGAFPPAAAAQAELEDAARALRKGTGAAVKLPWGQRFAGDD